MFSTITDLVKHLFSSEDLTSNEKHIPVSFLDGKILTLSDLRDDVRRLFDDIQDWPNGPVAISHHESYNFAVTLLALLNTSRDIAFPQNDKNDTLSELSEKGFHVFVNGELIITTTPLGNCDANCQNLIFFTSGSTGQPKEIRKDICHLEQEVLCLERQWGEGIENTITLSTVSHQHIYGMLFKIIWPLSVGRPFLSKNIDYWEDLKALCATDFLSQFEYNLISSPAHLTRYPDQFLLDVSEKPVKVFSSAGPLSFEAAQKTKQCLNTLPYEILGSTETGGMAWRRQYQQPEYWKAFDVVKLSVSTRNTLAVVSPFIGENKNFETNDLVEFHGYKKFLLKGRIDRIVKVEGKRVSLPDLEFFLKAHDWVEDAAVLILNDERKSVSAVLTLSQAGRSLLKEIGKFRMGRKLREEMSSKFDLVTIPRRWRFVDNIPQNAQGKRVFTELNALFD
ncbi:hypothetical protein [Curvivirga sp.]|uniref:hypothetical protein n=1 Tax=Curvivirga sp. TaxID=2856848 RepID=UPI003B5B498A